MLYSTVTRQSHFIEIMVTNKAYAEQKLAILLQLAYDHTQHRSS